MSPERTRLRPPSVLVRQPSLILFVVQILGVVLYPYMERSIAGRVVFEGFGVIVLALAIWVVRPTPTPTSIAVGLGVSASVLSIIDAFHHTPTLQLLAALLHAVFYLWAAVNLMIYMLADSRITRDELFAVGATFTLVAWGFAYLFIVVQTIHPGCFLSSFSAVPVRSWSELLFLTFTNLSGTGISDIAPVTGSARSSVMIEQLAGLGYIALFVSRLVGLTIRRQDERRREALAVARPETRSDPAGERAAD